MWAIVQHILQGFFFFFKSLLAAETVCFERSFYFHVFGDVSRENMYESMLRSYTRRQISQLPGPSTLFRLSLCTWLPAAGTVYMRYVKCIKDKVVKGKKKLWSSIRRGFQWEAEIAWMNANM